MNWEAIGAIGDFMGGGGIFVPTNVDYKFANFLVNTGAGADLTAVEGIQLQTDSIFPATDLQLDFLESAVVPEPSTGLLLGLSKRSKISSSSS